MTLWEVFWFFLPAGAANMAPILATRIPWARNWRTPLDFGRSFRGRRILGDNKTWRGLVVGTLVAVGVGLLQYRVIASSSESTGFIIAASAALGFGALAGDAFFSFLKRQRGIPAGHAWIPFDQIDYILGGLIMVYPFIPNELTVGIAIATLFMYTSLHFIVSYIGYLTGFKEKPV
jgi:CDP-2,3-bis-(O-geranylgeranyl)-sn-glycerol synthase